MPPRRSLAQVMREDRWITATGLPPGFVPEVGATVPISEPVREKMATIYLRGLGGFGQDQAPAYNPYPGTIPLNDAVPYYSGGSGPTTYPPYIPAPTVPLETLSALPTNPFSGLTAGETVGALGPIGCSLLPAGPARDACLALVRLIRGTGAGSGYQAGGTGGLEDCPTGYARNARGECVQTGIGGAIEKYAPFGETGRLSEDYGEAVMGAFGIPALLPMQVGTIQRKDGTQHPILRCPRGAVLGRDSLCYMKGSIPRNLRKNPPGTRPLLTGGDVRILGRARGLEKRIKKLATKHTHKPCSCSTRAPRRKKA